MKYITRDEEGRIVGIFAAEQYPDQETTNDDNVKLDESLFE